MSEDAEEGPHYVQDAFYLFLICAAVAVPLLAIYFFEKITTSSCTCTSECKCKPKKGKPADTDCNLATLACDGEGAGAAIIRSLAALAKTLGTMKWWEWLLAVLGGILTFTIGGGIAKGVRDRIAGKHSDSSDESSTWETATALFSEDRALAQQFKKMEDSRNDAREKIMAENKELEKKKQGATPADQAKDAKAIETNKTALKYMKDQADLMTTSREKAFDMLVAKKLSRSQRIDLEEIGEQAMKVRASVEEWRQAVNGAAESAEKGDVGARDTALDKAAEMPEPIKEQYDAFEAMVEGLG